MKQKKYLPIALALTVVTTASASAASYKLPQISNLLTSSSVCSQSQGILNELCSKYSFLSNSNQNLWVNQNLCQTQNDCGGSNFCNNLLFCENPCETPGDNQIQPPVTLPEEIPQKPETPEIPEIPETPITPEVPEKPEQPETPEVPEIPETPETPITPELPETPETPEETPSQNAFASEVLRLVNEERAKAGLNEVALSTGVQNAAQIRAEELIKSFSHTRPDGTSCFTALSEIGVSYRGAGENIAYGQTSPQEVMNGWMNSDGHRANILSSNFTTLGVGYTVVNGTPYWVQMFTY